MGYDDSSSPSSAQILGVWKRHEDWQYIAIRKKALESFLNQGGYNPRQVLEAWKEAGHLDVPMSRRGFATNIRIQGEVTPGFVKIKRSAFSIEA